MTFFKTVSFSVQTGGAKGRHQVPIQRRQGPVKGPVAKVMQKLNDKKEVAAIVSQIEAYKADQDSRKQLRNTIPALAFAHENLVSWVNAKNIAQNSQPKTIFRWM